MGMSKKDRQAKAEMIAALELAIRRVLIPASPACVQTQAEHDKLINAAAKSCLNSFARAAFKMYPRAGKPKGTPVHAP